MQHSSPSASSEGRGKVRSSRQSAAGVSNGDPAKAKAHEHRVDIGDEQCDLLGFEVFSGKLALDRRPKNPDVEDGEPTQDSVDARLTTKALSWGSRVLRLQDVISVSSCASALLTRDLDHGIYLLISFAALSGLLLFWPQTLHCARLSSGEEVLWSVLLSEAAEETEGLSVLGNHLGGGQKMGHWLRGPAVLCEAPASSHGILPQAWAWPG